MKSCSILKFPQANVIKLICADFPWHIPFWSPKMYNIIQCKIDYCITKLILLMLVLKNGSDKYIYELEITIDVSWAGEAAEECQLVGETLILTNTRQIYIYIYMQSK